MGRVKLEMEYRTNSRSRRATYMTRVTGLKKKASELSLLCGVSVLVASFSPELSGVQSWPEQDSDEFRCIKERYIRFRKSQTAAPFPPPPSSLPLLASQEIQAMSSKLAEIRERLSFLQGEASSNAAMASSYVQQDQTTLQVQDTVPPTPFLNDISMEDAPEFFLSDSSPMEDFAWCDSLLDAPEFFLSDSPIMSPMDDFAWCDSLLDYEKY